MTSHLRRLWVLPIAYLLIVAYSRALSAEDDEAQWTDVTVSAREPADPALDLRIFPDDSQRVPGNAATVFLRLAWDTNPEVWNVLSEASKYLTMPADQFEPQEARDDAPLLDLYELRRAAYRTYANWEYPIHEETALHRIRLPDAQQSRLVIRGLAVHSRADIVEGKIDDALEKITIGLGICRHLQVPPFTVVKLQQAGNSGAMLDRVEQLVGHPEAPNLYWALTALPRPFLSLREVVDWERNMLLSSIPELKQIDRPRTPDQWRQVVTRLFETISEYDQNWSVRVKAAGGAEQWQKNLVGPARRKLPALEPRVTKIQLETMSDDEVVVRYFAASYLTESDRAFRPLLLPPWQALPLLEKHQEKRSRWEHEAPELFLTLGTMGPYIYMWNLERRIDALRVIEALRDHAARHENNLPASLADIDGLPVPLDVITGKPFDYRREGDVAYLSARPIEILRWDKRFVIKYRIHIRPLRSATN